MVIRDESLEQFKDKFLYSKCTLNAIQLTLNKFVNNITEERIKDTITQLLGKINFYYGTIEEHFSAISFLGYNIVIRKYFNIFNGNEIKVALRNVIAHEIMHILIIELTDGNFFNRSFERSNQQIEESGDYFENVLFSVNIKYYSNLLISYLDNFENYKKSLPEFNKDIRDIYNNTCLCEENKATQLTDEECIKMRIIRNKINSSKYEQNVNRFGHCRKYYLLKSKNIYSK